MPTNANGYNTRLTDETLEKRFRDTFRSQSGAELVDDLYASGVIVPVVDFTAAAEGSALRSDLQTAFNFATGHSTVVNTSSNLASTPGFWLVDLTASIIGGGGGTYNGNIAVTDGFSSKTLFRVSGDGTTDNEIVLGNKFTVFLRTGDTLSATSSDTRIVLDVTYQQIATVNGDLVNPSGYDPS